MSGVTLRTCESRCCPGEEADLALLGLQALGSACTAPQLCDCLQSHILAKQVKRIKKMGNHRAHLHGLASPTLGWASLFERLPFEHH